MVAKVEWHPGQLIRTFGFIAPYKQAWRAQLYEKGSPWRLVGRDSYTGPMSRLLWLKRDDNCSS